MVSNTSFLHCTSSLSFQASRLTAGRLFFVLVIVADAVNADA
jgi:hypothetical protein